jgi:hypothetical protein
VLGARVKRALFGWLLNFAEKITYLTISFKFNVLKFSQPDNNGRRQQPKCRLLHCRALVYM